MQPLGFGKQAARPVLLRVGVFLTWAAKPSVGRSPEPRKIFRYYIELAPWVPRHSLHSWLRTARAESSRIAFSTVHNAWTRAPCLG